MKKIVKSLILIAAAAMGFTACQEELQNDAPLTEETVEVKFVASSADTKTSVDTSGDTPLFAWGENETFTVLEQTDALSEATNVVYEKDEEGKANITATFTGDANAGEYKYVTIYPKSGYVGNAGSIETVTLSLPAVQTMAENSYDPAADLMVSEVVTVPSRPTEAQMVRFTRMAAVAKMTLKNLALAEGDQVEQVIFTAEGKNLAGTVTADLNDPHAFTVADDNGVDNVTVNTTSSTDVYFTVLPTTLEAGNSYTVTVLTNKKIYIKNGAIPAEKSLVFEKGMVTRFGVDMAEVTPIDKWVLVRDASTLKEGDVVIFATHDLISSKYYAMSTTQNTNYRGYTEITKQDEFVINPSNDVQTFTLVKRYDDKVAFDFYDDINKGFIYAASSGNRYLKTQSYYNNNSLFYIEIENNTGVATVVAKDSEFTYNQLMFYDSSYSTDYFACLGSTKSKPICIYRLGGIVGKIPVVEANVTVPASDESVVISEDETANATAISDVVFNYVGDWTITPSVTYKGTDTGWLNVTYDAENNYLTYTAEANAGAKRNATVTLTATLGEQTLEPWTFNVIQKGVPQDISIAEFVKLAQDVNTTYRLTGKVVATATTSGTWKLSDEAGNIAQIKYLKTEDDGNPFLSASGVDVKLGDVMTVTAVVTASKATSACGSASYPSFYKGHYGLSISASPAAKYDGGTVTISVATNHNGTIDLPEHVTGEMEPSDYAEFSYTPGTSTATVTFATANTTTDNRKATVTFTYGLISTTVVAEQEVDPANKVKWNLVTDASTLATGDQIVIVALNTAKVLACQKSTAVVTSVSNFPAVEIEKSSDVVYDAEKVGAQVFTLVEGYKEGTFALQFTHNDETYYLYAPSSGLKGEVSTNDIDAQNSFAIKTVNSDTGETTILNDQPKYVMFNGASSGGTTFLSVSTTSSNVSNPAYAIAVYKK